MLPSQPGGCWRRTALPIVKLKWEICGSLLFRSLNFSPAKECKAVLVSLYRYKVVC